MDMKKQRLVRLSPEEMEHSTEPLVGEWVVDTPAPAPDAEAAAPDAQMLQAAEGFLLGYTAATVIMMDELGGQQLGKRKAIKDLLGRKFGRTLALYRDHGLKLQG